MRSIQCTDNRSMNSETSKYLTEYAELKSNEIFQRIDDYDVIRCSDVYWLVSHKSNRPKIEGDTDKEHIEDSEKTVAHPFDFERYNNTHEVLLCRKTKRMSCSCSTSNRIGMPCPHILACTRIKHCCMFSHRWYKLYNSIAYCADQDILKAFEERKKEELASNRKIDVSGIIDHLPVFKEVEIPSTRQQCRIAKQMLLSHCMHRQKHVVRKSDLLDWSCMTSEDNEKYFLIKKYLINFFEKISTSDECVNTSSDEQREVEEVISFDSQEQVMGKSMKKKNNNVSIDNDRSRYHLMNEKLKRIHKLCEGRKDVSEKMIEMMNKMEIEAMRMIQSKDTVVQREMDINSRAGIVSSNAPIECTPTRARYTCAYEKRK